MTSKQEQFWSGEGGDAYTDRNRVNFLFRIPFWQNILAKTGIRSALEVGCNIGSNLLALRTINPKLALTGIDLNKEALLQAASVGLFVMPSKIDHLRADFFDLAFTAGVLIHVPPEDLTATMQSIIKASSKYVLAVEYASDNGEEQAIEYRGQHGLLWRRDYGSLYESLGLTLVDSGERAQGFDDCHWWLFRKEQ